MTEDNLPMDNLVLQYRSYDRQKCFIGYSKSARWTEDLIGACEKVLSRPEFNLELDYADKSFAPDVLLQNKALELIANARYGIYDLSCWENDRGEWQLPRNVYVELGMAIALNRPTLMLRNNCNRHLKLPKCLESMSGSILEFSGTTTLTHTLETRLPQWLKAPPDVGWWNRYCVPGNRTCEFRESHPRASQWGRKTIQCHVSDGPDPDRVDFRALVDEVLERFSNVNVTYMDALTPMQGYDFLLCTHCKTVRSSSFAIYRITPFTPAETFIAIGISLVLERLFDYKIPKLLLIEHPHDLPSLLTGYEVVVARNDGERKKQLLHFMPIVMQRVRESTWKPRPLPFVDISCAPIEIVEKSEGESLEGTKTDGSEPLAEAEVVQWEIYSFGEFELDIRERVLRRSGFVLKLRPKVFQALEVLIRNAGRVVSRDEMINALWPDSFVEQSNLHVTMSMLRKALGDQGKLIRTLPGRGYRFIPTVPSKEAVIERTYCFFCGGTIAVDDEWCSHCGARQPPIIPVNDLAAKVKLTVLGTSEPNATFELPRTSNLVGRTDPHSNVFPEVDLTRFDHECKLSRRHARIFFQENRFFIEDLGSVNGTILNDLTKLSPRNPHPLHHGDKLRLGEMMLMFLHEGLVDHENDVDDWRDGVQPSRSDL